MSQSNPPQEITFQDLLSQKQWDNYSSYISEAPGYYAQQIDADMVREKQIRKALREGILEKKYSIRKYDSNLQEATELLFSGKVIAIDGTVAKHQMLSGLRCQIGIVAVNYANQKIRQAYFISEANLQNEIQDILEVLQKREFRNRSISDLVIRALMLYREREVALRPEFKDAYKMVHGPLLPFELMTGLGKLRALNSTLGILKKLIDDPKVFSVISTSQNSDYMTLGTALNQGEYMVDNKYSFGDEVADDPNFMAEGKWRPREFEKMKDFLKEYASMILLGVIRVGPRPYVFHAHRENFDLAASIIARDALMQHEKGFPLLMDYADNLCSEYFPAGDFSQIIGYQLAKEGEFLVESDERDMRRK